MLYKGKNIRFSSDFSAVVLEILEDFQTENT